ncbi:MAG: ATP-binding cassette domain-containing protein [Bacteroidales bacterium]|nr:ATP-binding cassette domain-containing protein [Bacteroidales bacterium]MDD3907079.1 ATP-binding cassette domain-containing protein [Bacteroidales bacterium]MDD4711959.1 ATP-binding cassette domain-containing protein [Bacteroidales bacterium]
MDTLIRLHDAVLRHPNVQFTEPINWEIQTGEHWAVIGPNGSGKTVFIDTLTGKYALRTGTCEYPLFETTGCKVSEAIKTMAFRDISNLSGDYENSAYQQRWNSQEAEESPAIGDLLQLNPDKAYSDKIIKIFSVKSLLGSKLIQLSSGELRKFLIVSTLMNRPKLLILDNPFIGLDAPSRDQLNQVLENLANLEGLQLIFVLSNPTDIPNIVTHILPIKDMTLSKTLSRTNFLADSTLLNNLFPLQQKTYNERIFNTYTQKDFAADSTDETEETTIDSVVQLCNVRIGYGKRTILKELNWTILRGERWALLGPNGAGKSTLLSLICADNPQSYANDIRLFNRKRGSGESIWDIKKHIGYVSPEMHSYYLKNTSCINIVGSGLFDTIGLYRRCNTEQLEACEKWMNIFGIGHLKDKSFLAISSGEQRLCLLARAFVKDPALLILDEPLHGLDVSNKLKVKKIIEDYCKDPDKTLIYVTHYIHEIPVCINNQFLLTKNK